MTAFKTEVKPDTYPAWIVSLMGAPVGADPDWDIFISFRVFTWMPTAEPPGHKYRR